MTEIGFYHLLATPLERALPKLLELGLKAGFRIVVLAGSAERVDHLDAALWTMTMPASCRMAAGATGVPSASRSG